MKLDMDCVRDILLLCESDLVEKPLSGDYFFQKYQEKWTQPELKYCLSKMIEGQLIEALHLNKDCDLSAQVFFVRSITWSGHQFLENIRDEKRWAGVKTALSGIRNYSLSAVSAVAEGITSAAISAYFSRQS